MNPITPIYKIGDLVYYPHKEWGTKHTLCPDCLGTKEWTIIFANGSTEKCTCQTCRHGYFSNGVIEYQEWKPMVRLLTIGSIYGWDPENGVRYMCTETGVGSGALYNEKDFYTDRDKAECRAAELHEEHMKYLAQQNFSKSKTGKKELGEMISTFGYVRGEKLKKIREFEMWAGISKINKDR